MQIRVNPTLSFKDAYKITFKHKDNFSGRARRSEFWNFVLLFQVYLIIILYTFVNFFVQSK